MFYMDTFVTYIHHGGKKIGDESVGVVERAVAGKERGVEGAVAGKEGGLRELLLVRKRVLKGLLLVRKRVLKGLLLVRKKGLRGLLLGMVQRKCQNQPVDKPPRQLKKKRKKTQSTI
ncbi:hypothetical protein AAHA92_01160 [Salvia divinorum]|uniref:Uncharacterized protein n=1 Tax=Salvia divinorum TaxID=28513 RepID=A0ABD1IN32_SALDI